MKRRLSVSLYGLTAGTTLACDTSACTLEVLPAVVVEIRDAVDGTPLAETARGLVRDGSFSDSLQPYGALANGVLISRSAAGEREGDYAVIVKHDGYSEWRQDGVRVDEDGCHVETAHLSAYLQRLQGS